MVRVAQVAEGVWKTDDVTMRFSNIRLRIARKKKHTQTRTPVQPEVKSLLTLASETAGRIYAPTVLTRTAGIGTLVDICTEVDKKKKKNVSTDYGFRR